MNTNTYHTIGLMSGTSLDGLDIAYCILRLDQESWFFNIELAKTVAYPPDIYKKLANCTQLSGLDLSLLDVDLGKWIGQETAKFIEKHSLKVDLIASHGHTIFHQPEKGITVQIGNGLEIQRACDLIVINDFRSRDVSLGGQGAPLVPIGDALLFQEYTACLNLGGIANISFDVEGKRIAYDIVPVNMMLNYLSQKLDKPYDENGHIARDGSIGGVLLDQFNNLSYYKSPPPKSLGYEWVNDNILSLLDNSSYTIEDQLATTVEHAAIQIAEVLPEGKTLVTGGGSYNKYLIKRLKSYLEGSHQIVIPDKVIVEYKEALIFALLGVLRYRNEVNCLSSVTGAEYDNCGGVIYLNN